MQSGAVVRHSSGQVPGILSLWGNMEKKGRAILLSVAAEGSRQPYPLATQVAVGVGTSSLPGSVRREASGGGASRKRPIPRR